MKFCSKKKCCIFSLKMVQRKMVCMLMAIALGFLCVFMASKHGNPDIWWTPLMWSIVFNRFLIGMFIFIWWVFTVHPIKMFNFILKPVFRGFFLGALVSLDLAIGVFMNTEIDSITKIRIFWLTILTWAIYGLIIDVTATKLTWQGKELLDY